MGELTGMTKPQDFPWFRRFGQLLLGLLAAWGLALVASQPHHAQVCGGLLELLGVWAVAKELLETRSVFEAHPIRAEIGDEAKRGATLLRAKIMAVFRPKQPVDIAARGVSAGSGWVVPSPTIKASGVVGETADQRLERIETSISQLWVAKQVNTR